jgi:hypothetical protein
MLEHMGPGSYYRHVPEQHIVELGQLIYTGLSYKSAYGGDPHIIFACLQVIRMAVHCHGPEFETLELLIVESCPFLDKENRAPGFQPDEQGEDRGNPNQ